MTSGREGLPVTIKRIEDIGRMKIVRADFFGREVNITVPDGQPIPLDANRIVFDPSRINIYCDGWIVNGEAA